MTSSEGQSEELPLAPRAVGSTGPEAGATGLDASVEGSNTGTERRAPGGGSIRASTGPGIRGAESPWESGWGSQGCALPWGAGARMSYSFWDLVWVRREPRAPGTCPVLLCSGRPFPLRVRREEQRINPPLSGAPLRGELSPLPGNTHTCTRISI